MLYENYYMELLGCNDAEAVFQKLLDTLALSNRRWDYFVNWEKVLENFKRVEIDLNTLNYLVGKTNIREEFSALIKRQPSIIKTIPILFALRDGNFDILINYLGGKLEYKHFSFEDADTNSITDSQIHDAVTFANEAGILDLIRSKTLKNLPDYVLGVEVGLDSNGRKNRGGRTMEKIVGHLLEEICANNNLQYLKEVTAPTIVHEWGIKFEDDETKRRYDFAVLAHSNLFLIETNFYGGGGSKLKATAGEYKSLHDFIEAQGSKFIWITDGLGWRNAIAPLEETFNHIDYLLNLFFVTSNILERILLSS